MNEQDFIDRIKKAKYSTRETAFFKFKCFVNHEKTIHILREKMVCNYCKHTLDKTLGVEFYKPISLTIFQAGLLWAIYVENIRPSDYARYPKCIAGKEFIANIKRINVSEGER